VKLFKHPLTFVKRRHRRLLTGTPPRPSSPAFPPPPAIFRQDIPCLRIRSGSLRRKLPLCRPSFFPFAYACPQAGDHALADALALRFHVGDSAVPAGLQAFRRNNCDSLPMGTHSAKRCMGHPLSQLRELRPRQGCPNASSTASFTHSSCRGRLFRRTNSFRDRTRQLHAISVCLIGQHPT
jgi:hypothetical protein